MVIVMYAGVLFAVFVAVVLAATRDARLAKESLSEIKVVGFLPICITSQIVRTDKERVHNNV
jgi:hypothetical protein